MDSKEMPRPGPDVDQAAFRAAMRQLAGAVSVITTGEGANRSGLTATAVTSLSVDPPTVMVCVNLTSSTLPILKSEQRFAINLLNQSQQAIADRFAGRTGLKGAARYGEDGWTRLSTGAPALEGALAVIDTELEEVIERHSHAILIGRVKAVILSPDSGGLIYWRGAYRTLDPA